jgi:hypothetical protein
MVANFRVNCVCGAIYDVIEASGYSKEQWPSKCVLCDRELFPPGKALVKCGSSGAPMRIESDALEKQVMAVKRIGMLTGGSDVPGLARSPISRSRWTSSANMGEDGAKMYGLALVQTPRSAGNASIISSSWANDIFVTCCCRT